MLIRSRQNIVLALCMKKMYKKKIQNVLDLDKDVC